ncbi:hypothetical protein EV360DRAFT_69396 [Lentinula raphanica]|nr:hypothetical protein EV360DRAFT_69396 [Lentinula raphanica]
MAFQTLPVTTNIQNQFQLLESDDSVIAYHCDRAFSLIENDIQMAEAESKYEARVYTIWSRFGNDLCSCSRCNDSNSELECHNQFYLPTIKSTKAHKMPDGALCIYNTESRELDPVLLMEAKTLELQDNEHWRSPGAITLERPSIFIQGIYSSLLIFDERKEIEVQKFIKRYLDATKKKIRETYAGSQEQRQSISAIIKRKPRPSDPHIQIPRDLLPKLVFFNEPIVLGNPARSYNPVILKAVKTILDKAGIVQQQPSWFTTDTANVDLENYESLNMNIGWKNVHDAYARSVNKEVDDFRANLGIDIWSPSNQSDSSYMDVDSPEEIIASKRDPYPPRRKVTGVVLDFNRDSAKAEDPNSDNSTTQMATGAGLGSPFRA